jgi:rhodanese-related sulfurtransferase
MLMNEQMKQSTPPALSPWEISVHEVRDMLKSGADFLFIDCRKPDEHEVANIEGARLIPMQDLDLHLPDLQPYRDKPIVVHCHTGRRSMTVTTVLRNQGFANVKSMAGGIERWSLEIDPSVPRY